MTKNGSNSAYGKAHVVLPIIDLNRCEGKGDCVANCPQGVFLIQPIRPEDRSGLSWLGKFKTAFKKEKAYAIHSEACLACGLCVRVCPEKAISLRPL